MLERAIRTLRGGPRFSDLCAPIDLAAQPALDRAGPDDPGLTEDQRQWVREGVVIRRGFFPNSILDPYIAEREALARAGDRGEGWVSATPYLHIPSLRALSLWPPLMALLESLLGEPAMLTLNLTGWKTTARDWHQDVYFQPPGVGGWYAAAWIALGPVGADVGPFEYVPGSHRWPVLSGEKVRGLLPPEDRYRRSAETGHEVWPSLSQALLAPIVEREIARRRARVASFMADKGDLLVWHGRLLHRGSRARMEGAERRALIAHYNAAGRRPDIARQQDGNGCYYGWWDEDLVWARTGRDGGLVWERRGSGETTVRQVGV